MSIGSTVAVGFLAIFLTGCAMSSTGESAGRAGNYWVYISYSPKGTPSGIRAYRMDGETGAVTGGEVVLEAPDPNFLALSNDQRFMYASTNGVDSEKKSVGSVTAFAVDASTGKLHELNTQASHGGPRGACVAGSGEQHGAGGELPGKYRCGARDQRRWHADAGGI